MKQQAVKRHFFAMLGALTAFHGLAPQSVAQDFSLEWAESVGGSGDENANNIRVTATGDIYVVGEFHGTVNFAPSGPTVERTSVGGEDVFLARYDSSGALVWVRSFGSVSNDNGTGLALKGGSVYICGRFDDSVDFDPDGIGDTHSSAGSADAFLTKYGSDGTYQWTRTWGGGGADAGLRVCAGPSDEVYVVGTFSGTVDFDPDALETDDCSSQGGKDVFLSRFDDAGVHQWVRCFGGVFDDTAQGLVVDAAGNSFVAGDFRDSVDFDPGPGIDSHTSNGDRDLFLVSFDSGGLYRWAQTVGGTDHDEAREAGIDLLGNVYVTGEFRSTVDFDPGAGLDECVSNGDADAFLTKYDGDGSYLWTRCWGGLGEEIGFAAVIEAGVVYVSGVFAQSVDFDPGPTVDTRISSGDPDGFLCRYGDNGAYIDVRVIGGIGFDYYRGVGFDAGRNLYALGGISNTVDLDPGPGEDKHMSQGGRDNFAARMSFGACLAVGDMNGDGVIDGGDVQLFVNALLGQ